MFCTPEITRLPLGLTSITFTVSLAVTLLELLIVPCALKLSSCDRVESGMKPSRPVPLSTLLAADLELLAEPLRLAVELRAAALVSIAPPVGRSWDFSAIEVPTAPWLVIQGEADEIVDPQAVFAWLATLPRQPRLVRMPDTSHFFHRKLIDLRGALKHGVQDWLPAA